jgi:hypothetical protein
MSRFDSRNPDTPMPNRPREVPWLSYLFLAACALGLLWSYLNLYHPPKVRAPGPLVAEDPVIAPVTVITPWRYNQYTLVPLATCQLRARVLHSERYFMDRQATLAPIDLALGWRQMSDSRVLDHLRITQGTRWYFYEYDGPAPLSSELIREQSKNVHIISANADIDRQVKGLITGQVIRAGGYLVKIEGLDGFSWISSTSPGGEGEGSCWVYYVNSLTVES